MNKIIFSLLSAFTIISIIIFSQLAFAENNFSDLTDAYPYLNSIENFAANDVVVGYPDGTFRPDQLVTRGEFLKIAVIYLYGKQESEILGFKNCFDDAKGHWAEHYICYAYQGGIVSGDGDTGLFNPNRNVNFTEAAKIIAFTLNDGKVINYSEPWYSKSVEIVENLRAIPPSVIGIDQFVSRAESVEMLYRSENLIDSFEEFNVFPDYSFSRTYTHLDKFNALLENTIFDINLMVVASDVGDLERFDDPDCGEVCPWHNEEFIFHNSKMFYDVNFDELDFLNEMIAVDENNVYYFLPTGVAGMIENVDLQSLKVPENFEILYYDINPKYSPSPYLAVYQIMDKDNIYLILNSDLFDGKGNLWRTALENEDPDLEFIRNDEEEAVLIVPNPDGEEAVFKGKHHFKVGDKVYYLYMEINGVDAESFEVYINDARFEWGQNFSRDKNNVYFKEVLVEAADPDTLTPSISSWYYEDKNFVYNHKGGKLEDIDSQNYETAANGYAILGDDKVYMFGNLVEGMNPDTFEFQSINCINDSDSYFLEENINSGEYTYNEVSQEEWLEECANVNPS